MLWLPNAFLFSSCSSGVQTADGWSGDLLYCLLDESFINVLITLHFRSLRYSVYPVFSLIPHRLHAILSLFI